MKCRLHRQVLEAANVWEWVDAPLAIRGDAPDARERLRVSLASQPEIEVVAEAANGEEAVCSRSRIVLTSS